MLHNLFILHKMLFIFYKFTYQPGQIRVNAFYASRKCYFTKNKLFFSPFEVTLYFLLLVLPKLLEPNGYLMLNTDFCVCDHFIGPK